MVENKQSILEFFKVKASGVILKALDWKASLFITITSTDIRKSVPISAFLLIQKVPRIWILKVKSSELIIIQLFTGLPSALLLRTDLNNTYFLKNTSVWLAGLVGASVRCYSHYLISSPVSVYLIISQILRQVIKLSDLLINTTEKLRGTVFNGVMDEYQLQARNV